MANTAFKLFSDPQVAREALVALRASGYPAEAIGVLTRKGGEGAKVAAELQAQPEAAGNMPEVGEVAAVGGAALGLGAESNDVVASLAATLGLSREAVETFGISLLRGGVLVVVQPSEGLPDAHRILRSAEPANVRIPKEPNEGFGIADRRTTTNPNDGQLSGDFRKF